MSRLHVPFRLALAVALLALLMFAGAAAGTGYLVEDHSERAERNRRVESAASQIERGLTQVATARGTPDLTRSLAKLKVSAQVWQVSPSARRLIYASGDLAVRTGKAIAAKTGAATKSDSLPVPGKPEEQREVDLYASLTDPSHRELVALASGVAALLAGGVLLLWAVSRWLVSPLRRLSAQVDAIAGGDPIERGATSPIREVGNVGAAVAGMAITLAQTAERDARIEAERRLLVSSIAHDLRTPLFSLRGHLDAIAAGMGDPHERLDRAREKARQIDRLVSSLFDYARAQIDDRPRLQTTDLVQEVTDTTAAFELDADQRGIELRTTGRPDVPVTIDRRGFERALANVIDNALRHTPTGGAIDITCGEDTDGPFVRVIDDGPGIAPDLLPRIFEPMVRDASAQNGRTGGIGGGGLGLTIAARLLTTQGGAICAANEPGRGATFTLRLPRTTTPEQPE